MCSLACLDPDRLGFGILLVGKQPLFPAAEARLLEPTERHGIVTFREAVDGHGAGTDGTCHAMSHVEIVSVNGGRQSVVGLVRDENCFLLVRDRNHRKHGSEYLFLGNGQDNIFLRDLASGAISCIKQNVDPNIAYGIFINASISDNGQFVAFQSHSWNKKVNSWDIHLQDTFTGIISPILVENLHDHSIENIRFLKKIHSFYLR